MPVGARMKGTAAGVLLVVVTAGVGWGFLLWRDVGRLKATREAWAVEEAAYARFSGIRSQALAAEGACLELAGSWKAQARCGGVLRTCQDQAPGWIQIGKLDLTSAYGYGHEAARSGPDRGGQPVRQRTLVLAGWCEGASGAERILAYQSNLQSAEPVRAVVSEVRLQGMERVASREGGSGGDGNRFAIRFAFHPEAMRLGEEVE